MSDRRLRWLIPLLLAASPAAAEPSVTILDLPFRATAMRGPQSEVAVAVATSGLLPMARGKDGDTGKGSQSGKGAGAGEEESAPLVVVWGKEGGAAVSLADGALRTTLIGAEAIEGLAASETPRGALPGSRRALSGAIGAYLTGPTRAAGADVPAAAALTIRERQPVAMGGDPKPVPVSTVTVPAGADHVFAALRPRALHLSGQAAFAATTLQPVRSGVALLTRDGPGGWTVTARTPPQAGGPLKIAAVADLAGTGAPQIATVNAASGALQLWSIAADPMTATAEAPGYSAGTGDGDAGALVTDAAGVPELALATAGGAALALLSLKGGITERVRAPLPAPAAFGVAALGTGREARVLVGLADGRIAVVTPEGRP